MAEFAATITLRVMYTAKEAELTTGERAHGLAETMVAILRGSPKFKVVEIECDSVGNVEPLGNDNDLIQLRTTP